MIKDLIPKEDQPNGKVEVIDGETYWMGNKIDKCPMCGIAPTNVDDCGQFGNPQCPCFGIGEGQPTIDRTETCTSDERRLLDVLKEVLLMADDAYEDVHDPVYVWHIKMSVPVASTVEPSEIERLLQNHAVDFETDLHGFSSGRYGARERRD